MTEALGAVRDSRAAAQHRVPAARCWRGRRCATARRAHAVHRGASRRADARAAGAALARGRGRAGGAASRARTPAPATGGRRRAGARRSVADCSGRWPGRRRGCRRRVQRDRERDGDWVGRASTASGVTLDGRRRRVRRHATTATARLRVDGASAHRRRRRAAGDVVWVSIDGEVFEFQVDAGHGRRASQPRAIRTRSRRRCPATVVRVAVRPATTVQAGDTLDRARGDEDGAADPRAARRRRPRRPLPRRRTRAAGTVLVELRGRLSQWRLSRLWACPIDLARRVNCETITVYEVGPRDGLQNEAAHDRRPRTRLRSSIALSAAGLPRHRGVRVRQPEVGAADGGRGGGVRRHRAPARHALHRARAEPDGPRARARRRASPTSRVFAAASETFSRRNINQSIDESLATYAEVARAALAAGLRVRGYLSTAFGCPVRRRRARSSASSR